MVPFLFFWLVWTALHPELPSQERPVLFYSNQVRQDLKLVFSSAIKQAKRSLYLSIYALTDPGIIALLNQKSGQGVAITVLYDPTASADLKHLLNPSIHTFPVQGDGLMHRKILVVDGSLVLLGSANMTTQSLKMHDNLVVGFLNPELGAFLSSSPLPSLRSPLGELWMLPDPSGRALNSVIEEIRKARKSIAIAMFTLTHPDLIQALIDAHQRGVKVQCAVDYYTAQGASSKALDSLAAAGVPIYLSRGQQLLHHKWALIDKQTLIFGSANWTKAAFTRNCDALFILTTLSPDQKKFMKKLWKRIQLESSCEEEHPQRTEKDAILNGRKRT